MLCHSHTFNLSTTSCACHFFPVLIDNHQLATKFGFELEIQLLFKLISVLLKNVSTIAYSATHTDKKKKKQAGTICVTLIFVINIFY